MHLLQRHLGGDRAQRRRELAFEEIADAVWLHGAAAERLRSDRHGFLGRLNAQEEFGDEVDAHAVAVISAVVCPRRTSIRITFMLTGVISCRTGMTKAPPLMTTFSPPKPVRTKAVSLVERR